MQCPQCKGYSLEPYEIEAGLIASQCQKCEGTLLPLMNYRYWADQNPDIAPFDTSKPITAEDSEQAKLCPKCSRFMTRYTIGEGSENKLELCSGCDEAWLDHGEWQLLKTLDLQGKLPAIFTEAWQRNIRLKKQEASLKANYKERLGADVFDKADEFKQWLEQQENRNEITQYLVTRLD